MNYTKIVKVDTVPYTKAVKFDTVSNLLNYPF